LPPRDVELRGTGRRQLVEVTLLILAGLLLAIATVNDVVEQTHVNHRLNADLRTWRAYTGHDYKNVSTEQDLYGHTTKDVVCGNTTPGPPKERIQLCLQMTGPVIHGRRAARGGWYLPRGSKTRRLPLRLLRHGDAAQFCGKAATGAAEIPKGPRRKRPVSATVAFPADAGGAAVMRGAHAGSVVAARGADDPRGRVAPLDARPAELLVRRGVHARARAAPEPVGDAARSGSHREHAAALVCDRLGRRARVRDRRDRAALALRARGHRDRARRLGDRTRADRPPRRCDRGGRGSSR